ncbi:MAG: NAD(P)-dependent oxidoreductase [Alphaproteobacteria bacterium]|nr:MAG: NAD(P)-dependent oxidoreductase [Alphaproteobacteria bacterium]
MTSYPLYILTGATGWLGRRIALALTEGLEGVSDVAGVKGARVRALVFPGEDASRLKAMGVEIVEGDVRDSDSLIKLMQDGEGACVIHTAGLIHPSLFTKDFFAVNEGGTKNLLLAATTAKVGRMLVVSSNSPIGCNPAPEHRFDEDSPFNPYMGYGKSKMNMELLLRAAMETTGYPGITIIRAPWFYGPGQPPRQTDFFRMVKAGRFPILGAGLNQRSMGYVDSLAQGILLACLSEKAKGETYWLADERPYPMVEIIDTVKAVLKEDFGMQVADKNLHAPAIIGDFAQLADAILQATGLYQQKIHVLSEMNKTIACDISKAKRELGFRPICDLREGMRRSIDWCLASGQKI